MPERNYIAKNLQVLCWLGIKKHLLFTPSEYLKHLSENARIPETDLRKILEGTAIPSSEELSRLCMFFTGQESIEGIEDRYLFADIVENGKADILRRNIAYVTENIPQGCVRDFCNQIGVNISTYNRWKNGKTEPDRYAQEQIAQHFGFEDKQVLSHEMLFLEVEEAPIPLRKMICKNLIDQIGRDEFLVLYPVLKKLLS